MDGKPQRSLVLASASPRRKLLLEQIGLPFTVKAVDIDETPLSGEDPAHFVERLARAKAEAGFERFGDDRALVLGSDTTVVHNGRILGKPRNREQGLAMLNQLSGGVHNVMTAVALAGQFGCYARLAVTEVHFRALATDEILAYWETGEPVDKAGAYGIQGKAAVFVTAIYGSYSSVVGLPLEETAELLAEAGQPVWLSWGSAGGKGQGHD